MLVTVEAGSVVELPARVLVIMRSGMKGGPTNAACDDEEVDVVGSTGVNAELEAGGPNMGGAELGVVDWVAAELVELAALENTAGWIELGSFVVEAT